LQSLRKKTTKLLEWSNRSIADRKKIARFYRDEASLFIAQEADREIVEAAVRILRRPLAYREGKRSGTRECVMRRFPYILIYRIRATKISVVRVLHQALRYFN
jgi:addiction module RelE/StbE family toxin